LLARVNGQIEVCKWLPSDALHICYSLQYLLVCGVFPGIIYCRVKQLVCADYWWSFLSTSLCGNSALMLN